MAAHDDTKYGYVDEATTLPAIPALHTHPATTLVPVLLAGQGAGLHDDE